MSFSIETISTLSEDDLQSAAGLTTGDFGRGNDSRNRQDTEDHLLGDDYLQIMRKNEDLVAFATYRRLLWR